MSRRRDRRRQEELSSRSRSAARRRWQESFAARTLAWFRARWSIFRFALLFALLVSGFYLLAARPSYQRWILDPYLEANATGAAALLRGLGEEVSSQGKSLGGHRFVMEAEAGCDGIEPSALFAAAVLAFPAPIRRKLLGLATGIPSLLVINFVRMLSLYYAGSRSEELLNLTHLSLWPPLFVLLAGGLWSLWALRALEARPAGDAAH